MSPRHALSLCLLWAALFAAAPGRALEPAEAERAVTLGHEGLALFQKGALAEAYERFAEAEALVHSPVFLLHMARAKRGLGDLVTARAHAVRVAREPLPTGAPASWLGAQADAIRELGELDASIPSLRIELLGAPSGATVTIDGVEIPSSALAAPIPQNPGERRIVARAAGAEVRETVRLEAQGQVVPVRLVFAPPPPEAARPALPPALSSAPPREGGSLLPGLVVLGVGALGLGVGVGAGLAAESKADDVLSRCEGDRCLASDESLAGEAEDLAALSTVSFIAAGVAVPLGVVLIVLRPFGESSEPVVVTPSAGGVRVRGVF